MSTIANNLAVTVDETDVAVEASHDPSKPEDIVDVSKEQGEMGREDRSAYDPEMPYCRCRGPYNDDAEDGNMVECSNQKCLTGWYHLKCLGMKKMPPDDWECRRCKDWRFKMPKPSHERVHWYGQNVHAEGHTIDEKLEGERSRILKLKERTEMEAASAGEWLKRFKGALAEEEKQKAAKSSKKVPAVRKDSPLDTKDETKTEAAARSKRKAVPADVSNEEDDRPAKRGKGKN